MTSKSRESSIALVVAGMVIAAMAGCLRPTPYQQTTIEWTRRAKLHQTYQEIIQLAATYKSAAWRAAHATKEADARGLTGAARDQHVAQARGAATAAVEIEMLVTTWDRRENDLDRGASSVWRVRLLDDGGGEIAPLEIIKDKRPVLAVRADFPAMGDFATPYVARFPIKPGMSTIRLRMSSSRGGVEVSWPAE